MTVLEESPVDSQIVREWLIDGNRYTVIANRFKDTSEFVEPAQDVFYEVYNAEGHCLCDDCPATEPGEADIRRLIEEGYQD